MDSKITITKIILFLGDKNVGRNSIRAFFSIEKQDRFIISMSGSLTLNKVFVDNYIFNYMLWLRTGTPSFLNNNLLFYHPLKPDLIIIIYDITNQESFNNIENWFENFYNYYQKSLPVFIIGNKIDLRKSQNIFISQEQGEKLIQRLKKNYSNDIFFFETSAKNGTNINEMFSFLVNYLKQKQDGK